MTARSHGCSILGLLLLHMLGGISQNYAQEKPPAQKKEQVNKTDGPAFIKSCKAATALVQLKGHGSGSAFCVRRDGVFLTNRHVVEGISPGQSLDLVLHAGEKTELVLQAKLVHISSDQQVDLAILKAPPHEQFVAIELGDDAAVVETDSVTAFGFPFGRNLAGDRQHFPNVTVTSGKVSSLRRQDDELVAIQIDAAINPGCSGGPLVDQRGKVVGVVFAIIPRSGLALAVPASKVRSYLAMPHLVLIHDEIKYSERFETRKLEAELIEIPASSEPLTVELTLQVNDAETRTLPFAGRDTTYSVSTALFKQPHEPSELVLKIWRGRTATLARINDQAISYGQHSITLSACRVIERRHDTHLIQTVDGDRFAVDQLDLPPARLDEAREFNLALSDRIQIAVEAPSVPEISYELTARRDKETIATSTGLIICTGQPRHLSDEIPESGETDDPASDRFTVDAMIEDQATLCLRSDAMWWEYTGATAPGTQDGNRAYVLLDGRKWYLQWQQDSDGHFYSRPLPWQVGGLLHDFNLLSIHETPRGPHLPQRGTIEVKESQFGEEPTRITFKDSANGSAIYKVHVQPKVSWPIPTPAPKRSQLPTSGRWNFDDDSAVSIRDVTGHGHVGHGPAPASVAGKVGKALALDGGNLNCGNIGNFERTEAFSLGGWVYVTNTLVAKEIVAHMDGRLGYRGYDIWIRDRLFFQLVHDAPSQNAIVVSSAEVLKPFCWYHVFAAYDGSGNSAGIHLYIDGAEAPAIVEMDKLTETIQIPVPFRIGQREPASPVSDPMRGRVDEIRLYRRLVKPEEIRDLAFATEPGPAPAGITTLSDQLVGYWSFDDPTTGDATPNQMQDHSGFDHHGTVEFAEPGISFEPGKRGQAIKLNNRVIQFDGRTGDYERTDAFSIGCWVNRTDKPEQSLISKLEQCPPFRGYDLILQNGLPRLSFYSVWDGGQGEPQRALSVVGQTPIPGNEWHHVLVTYDGSSKAAGVKIYMDGKPIELKTECDTLDGSIRNATPLCLGHRFNHPAYAYEGLIDEAVTISRCLNTEDVSNLMAGRAVDEKAKQ